MNKAKLDVRSKITKELNNLQKKCLQLERFQLLYQQMLEPLEGYFFVIDYEGNFLQCSVTTNEMPKSFETKNLVGKNLRDVFPKGRASFKLEFIRQTLDTKSSRVIEYSLPINNKNFHFETICIPILNCPDQSKKAVVFTREISTTK